MTPGCAGRSSSLPTSVLTPSDTASRVRARSAAKEFDEKFEQAASEIAGGVPVITAGRALRDAVRRHPSHRFLVVAPPWFSDATLDALIRYLSTPDRALHVIRYELDPSWYRCARSDLCDAGARYAIDPARMAEQVAALDPAAVDAVIVLGGGLRSLAAQARRRHEFGLEPLISDEEHRDEEHRCLSATQEISWHSH